MLSGNYEANAAIRKALPVKVILVEKTIKDSFANRLVCKPKKIAHGSKCMPL